MMGFPNLQKQRGLSLSGFILVLLLIGAGAVITIQVVPAVVEYQSIKKAVKNSLEKGNSVASIEAAFNKQANAGYITAISGSDLNIVKVGGEFVVSFAYTKKLPLFGPVSLLIDFANSEKN